MIIEKDYVDKDYLVDFQRFYVRSFEHIKKLTTRVHFFSSFITETSLKKLLNDNELIKQQPNYLGFSIVRPIYDHEGNPRIGRTLLKTYPVKKDGNHKRFYITEKNNVSLFGANLTVKSVPFQAQDRGVSACATIALWTTLQSLTAQYKLKSYSPAEITEIATSFPSQFRMFPQGGLTVGQMINCVHSIGLDVEIVTELTDDIITTAVKAYTYAGIPIIANLMLSGVRSGQRFYDYHAVVIVGYQCDNDGNITELYVHDDNVGPFKRVKPEDSHFTMWMNTDNANVYIEYDSIRLLRFLIPIYHKVRLTFSSIYYNYTYRKEDVDTTKFNFELILTTVQKYKNELTDKKFRIKNKPYVLCKNMPRFLWIQRTTDRRSQKRVQDDVFDGTAIECKEPYVTIEYCKA
jgi:hypothetical protein